MEHVVSGIDLGSPDSVTTVSVGQARFLNADVWIAAAVDVEEDRRRRGAGAGPLVSYETLTQLWEIPAGGRVSAGVDESARLDALRRRWPAALRHEDGYWTRDYRPAASVTAVFAATGSPIDRVRVAARFARFARRYAVGVDFGIASPAAIRVAERWGVGAANADLTVTVESAAAQYRRPSVWDWLFSEIAYQACRNRFDQA